MKALPARLRVPERWRNGLGQTATIDEHGPWRVSLAQISDASAFSNFPGASRALMPISPTGLALSINGRRQALNATEVSEFGGEDTVLAFKPEKPTEVINLIWLSARHEGKLSTATVSDELTLEADAATLVVLVTEGALVVEGGPSLGRLDALRLDSGETVTLSGNGALVLARVSPAAQ